MPVSSVERPVSALRQRMLEDMAMRGQHGIFDNMPDDLAARQLGGVDLLPLRRAEVGVDRDEQRYRGGHEIGGAGARVRRTAAAGECERGDGEQSGEL